MPVWDSKGERGGGQERKSVCVCVEKMEQGEEGGRQRPSDLRLTNRKLPCLAFVRPLSFSWREEKEEEGGDWGGGAGNYTVTPLSPTTSPPSIFPPSMSHSFSLFLIVIQALFIISLFPVKLRNHTEILRALN